MKKARKSSTPDETLDLYGVPCPMNAARALLTLQAMDAGQILEILVDDGEPRANVPESLREDGHEILDIACADGRCRVLVRVGA